MLARTLAFFILLGMVSCTGLRKAERFDERDPVTTVIPFELIDNRIFVDVYLEGQGPFSFIFDTGSTNVVTPKIAKLLKLETQRVEDGTGAGEKAFPVEGTKIQDLRIGKIHFIDQNFSVIDMSEIQKAFNLAKIDGLFGYEVLQKYLAAIDYENNRLTLTNDSKTLDKSMYEEVPFHMAANKPVIEGHINGLPAKILIDTGDRSSLTVFKNFRDQHTLVARLYAGAKERVTGYGAGGPIPAKLGTISTLQIAPTIILEKVISRAPTTTKGFNALKDMNASIGNEVLRQFHVVFDYKNNVVYLAKNMAFGEPIKFTEVPNPLLK